MVHIKIIYPTGAIQSITAPNGTSVQIEGGVEIVKRVDGMSRFNMSKDDFEIFMGRNQWSIVTAENPNGLRLSEEQNDTLMKRAYSFLKRRYTDINVIGGKWNGVDETSFLVFEMDSSHAAQFCNVFSQECAATSKGLIYRDGNVAKRESQDTIYTDATDNYSVVNLEGEEVKFQIKYK